MKLCIITNISLMFDLLFNIENRVNHTIVEIIIGDYSSFDDMIMVHKQSEMGKTNNSISKSYFNNYKFFYRIFFFKD